MKCVICKNGDTAPGTATVALDREIATVVFRSVPAEICENCGEEYVDDETAKRLLALLEDAVNAGVVVDVRRYAAA